MRDSGRESPLDKQSAEDLTEIRTLGEDRTSREGIRLVRSLR